MLAKLQNDLCARLFITRHFIGVFYIYFIPCSGAVWCFLRSYIFGRKITELLLHCSHRIRPRASQLWLVPLLVALTVITWVRWDLPDVSTVKSLLWRKYPWRKIGILWEVHWDIMNIPYVLVLTINCSLICESSGPCIPVSFSSSRCITDIACFHVQMAPIWPLGVPSQWLLCPLMGLPHSWAPP